MKTKKIEKEDLNILKYYDLSSSEESKMRLIANLLIQVSEGLSPSDAAEIGHQICSFLEKKVIFEHFFLGRTFPQHLMSKQQFVSKVASLKISLKEQKDNHEWSY